MPPFTDYVDPTLADGVSVFQHADHWALRRRDGRFVVIGGVAVELLTDTAEIGTHPTLGPAFDQAGFLHSEGGPSGAASVQVAGGGVICDRVGPLILQAGSGRADSDSAVECQLLDSPPAFDTHAGPGASSSPAVVVWPEGGQVFISPYVHPADQQPVRAADILRRRIAASPVPELLRGYLHARRRAPVTLSAASALLVAALVLTQVEDGAAARRRLRVIDIDAATWTDHRVLPVPLPHEGTPA